MDLIERQAAIDAVSNMLRRKFGIGGDLAEITLAGLPSAQPETHEERTETHSCDCIERQAAIEVLEERLHANGYSNVALVSELNRSIGYLMRLPSAQPEIVRCKDCIFHGLCRTSPKWAVAPKDDWYCADAERRTNEAD